MMFLMNRVQAEQAIKSLLDEYKASDYHREDVSSNPDKQRKDVFEIHHSTVQAVIFTDRQTSLINNLTRVSEQSDDLNKIGIEHAPIMHEDGSVRTDVVLLNLSIGRPWPRS